MSNLIHRLTAMASLCWVLAVCAHAQTGSPRHSILIDRSGSMEGFFATGKIDEVQHVLSGLCRGASDAYYFVDRDIVPVGQETQGFGNNTYLSNAFDRLVARQPAPQILWLITDNQPSVGNQTDSDRDIAEFYNRLRSESVKRLYFFPLKLDFKGKLFRENDDVLAADYTGKRGLLIYAVLLDDSARDEFERATAEFQSSYRPAGVSELRRILIKPLEQDTITAKIIPRDKFRVENENQLFAGDFNEGSPISGKFDIELTSQLGQMKISRADIDVTVPVKFRTGDFTESEIVPDFSPHDIGDFEPQNKKSIGVELKAPPLHIRSNPISWWNCITHNRGDVSGAIRILIKVPGQNFQVTSNLANEFSTDRDIYNDARENVQSRIYKLDDLVKRMMPEQQVEIQPHIGNSQNGMIPVRLVIRYPKWPVVVMIAGILVLLLLLILLRRFLVRPRLYRLTWDRGHYRACPDFRLWPFLGQRVNLDDHKVAFIQKTLTGIRVRAAGGYTVDDSRSRFVNPNGTDFSVSRSETGAGMNFYFSSTTAVLRSANAPRGNDDGILGGVSYGSAGDTGGELSGVGAAPPIRKPTSRQTGGNGKSPDEKTGGNDAFNLDDLFP